MKNLKQRINHLIEEYNTVVKVVDKDARESNRSYGGMIRSVKGKLQEYLTEEIVKIAWEVVGGDFSRIEINSKKQKIPIERNYIDKIQDEEIKKYILSNINQYYFGISVDKQIFIDKELVMAIECKAYTENAMIKRILVDFSLLRSLFPNLYMLFISIRKPAWWRLLSIQNKNIWQLFYTYIDVVFSRNRFKNCDFFGRRKAC